MPERLAAASDWAKSLDHEQHLPAMPKMDDVFLASLPPFLRVLLTSDGTVTKMLEAFFWESIDVVRLRQHYGSAAKATWLGLGESDEVMIRDVALRGERTGRVYAKASSLVAPERIPASLRHQLEEKQIGIGQLIRRCGLESYRQLIEVGLDSHSTTNMIYRIYQINVEQKPAMLITEYFPRALYE